MTYKLFSFRSGLRLTEEEIVSDEYYFPWESVSIEEMILQEDKIVELKEYNPVTKEDDILTHTIPAGSLDPEYLKKLNCQHLIELGWLRFSDKDDYVEKMELEYFDDVDDEGVPFVNSKEVSKKVLDNVYVRSYALCCDHCTTYKLPERFEAKWEDVDAMTDQELRNLYEVSDNINKVELRLGNDSQLNSWGLRNVDWENTSPYVEVPVSNAPKKPTAPGPTGGTNTEGIRE